MRVIRLSRDTGQCAGAAVMTGITNPSLVHVRCVCILPPGRGDRFLAPPLIDVFETEPVGDLQMAGMFMTITRAHIKAGSETEARKLLAKEMLPSDGKKPGDVVEGLVGFGLMRAKKDPSMYGIVTVWESEAAFDKMSSNANAATGGGFVEKLKALSTGKVEGEGFYIESL